MDNFIADIVQEALVVRNNQQCFLPSLQVTTQKRVNESVLISGSMNYQQSN